MCDWQGVMPGTRCVGCRMATLAIDNRVCRLRSLRTLPFRCVGLSFWSPVSHRCVMPCACLSPGVRIGGHSASIRVCLVSCLSPGMAVGWHRWPSIWLSIVTSRPHISCVWMTSGCHLGDCLAHACQNGWIGGHLALLWCHACHMGTSRVPELVKFGQIGS